MNALKKLTLVLFVLVGAVPFCVGMVFWITKAWFDAANIAAGELIDWAQQ